MVTLSQLLSRPYSCKSLSQAPKKCLKRPCCSQFQPFQAQSCDKHSSYLFAPCRCGGMPVRHLRDCICAPPGVVRSDHLSTRNPPRGRSSICATPQWLSHNYDDYGSILIRIWNPYIGYEHERFEWVTIQQCGGRLSFCPRFQRTVV